VPETGPIGKDVRAISEGAFALRGSLTEVQQRIEDAAKEAGERSKGPEADLSPALG